MPIKVGKRARPLGFQNDKFISLLPKAEGVVPVGELGRETPLDFSSLEAARTTVLLRELYSKYDDLRKSPEKEKTTWDRFHEAEAQCLRTNQRSRIVAMSFCEPRSCRLQLSS